MEEDQGSPAMTFEESTACSSREEVRDNSQRKPVERDNSQGEK